MVIGVVGANGQMGSSCVRHLLDRGQQVRAMVRDAGRAADLAAQGAEVVVLDVTDPAQRSAALRDVHCLITSANAVVPRAGDDPRAFDRGLQALVDEAVAAGLERLVLPSVQTADVEDRIPPMRAKRALEDTMARSPVQGWSLRLPPFMESWFALVGSSLPLRGETHATLGRPSPFLQRFRAMTGSLVEDRGILLVPGSPDHRHAFISVEDAARAAVEAALTDRPAPSQPLDVAGPEVLSWRQVADLFGEVLQRRVRVVSTPGAVYAAASRLLAPVATVPSRVMALNVFMAAGQFDGGVPGGGLVDPATMTTARDFLSRKAALAPTLERVP